MSEVIKTVNLTKIYGDVYAADKVNLSVKKGEIFGLLGLNGAGKTTIIRALLGMIKPSAGDCYLQGQRVSAKSIDIWRDVGYIVETPHSYPELTVRENLEIVHRLRGIEDTSSIDRIIERLKLQDYYMRKAKHLSLGNAQRLGIAKAMIHKPQILILDEPTNGLDPAGIVQVRRLLVSLAEDLGVTVLVSSHKLDEISKMATNIAIIHKGKLVKKIDSTELEDQLEKVLIIDGRDRASIAKILSDAGYDTSPSLKDPIQIKDSHAVDNPDKIASLLVEAGYPPTLLKVQIEDLENYFLKVIGEMGGSIS